MVYPHIQTVMHPSTNPTALGQESNSQAVDHKSDALTQLTTIHDQVVLLYSVGAFDGERSDTISSEQPYRGHDQESHQWKRHTNRQSGQIKTYIRV